MRQNRGLGVGIQPLVTAWAQILIGGLAAWESNVNREGWKAKPGISKLCEVGVDILLRSRGVGVAVGVGSITLSFEISRVNKQGTCFHTMPKCLLFM